MRTTWPPVEAAGSLVVAVALCAALAAVLSACRGTEDPSLPDSYVRISLDKDEPERLLRYYFGGYVSPEPADPFEAGLVDERSGRLYVDMEALEQHQPEAADALQDANASGRIEWEEFEQFVDETYDAVRSAPDSLAGIVREAAFDAADADWMRVEVDGVMTTARRRIYVRESAVRSALVDYVSNGRRIMYPVGTTFIGEHYLDDRRVETTVMRKRQDGFWDFFVYGRDGSLARGTSTPPRELKSPIQCVGCHFGDKLFEPEESFPAGARPGPHGPRHLYVDASLRDEEIVRHFDEHRKRSDTVLGLYTTLFAAQLRAARREGRLDENDAELLDTLGL